MPQIPLSEAPIGATLAETIFDDRGRVLLRAGCVLTPTMIACLERWTVGTISIEHLPVESSPPPPATDPPVPLNQRWNELFRGHEDSVEMQTIQRALSNWLATGQSVVTEGT